MLAHLVHQRLWRGVHALILQLGHQLGNQVEIAAAGQEQVALQVAGHQDVHGRRGGLIEFPAPVVHAGVDEVGQHVVSVGGAHQFGHRQPHPPGVFPGQYVAEVARGHDEIHRFAQPDLPPKHQIAIGLEIVGHLGGQPPDVDGVGAGQPRAGGRRPAVLLVVGEYVLHAGLGVVEIAPDRANAHVAAGLGDHLGLLHVADAAVGIEYHDPRALDIVEALQRRLAGVAAGGGEDHDLLVHAQLGLGGGDQPGQHGQRHVLEGRGGAAKQLEHEVRPHLLNGREIRCLELAGIGGFDQ